MPKKQTHILKQKSMPNWVVIGFITIFAVIAGYFAYDTFAEGPIHRRYLYCTSIDFCFVHNHGYGRKILKKVRRDPFCRRVTGVNIEFYSPRAPAKWYCPYK